MGSVLVSGAVRRAVASASRPRAQQEQMPDDHLAPREGGGRRRHPILLPPAPPRPYCGPTKHCALLTRASHASIMRRGPAACGINKGAAGALLAAEGAGAFCRTWTGLLCASPLPSEKLRACAALCDAASATHGKEPSAEDLLSLVSLALAACIDAGAAPQLACHLRIAESGLARSAAKNKEGYCLTTVQAALHYVTSQAPPVVGRAISA